MNWLDIKARVLQIAKQRFGRGERIEPDRMRDLVRPSGIARQDDGEMLVAGWQRRKRVPGREARPRRFDTLGVPLVRSDGELQIAIARPRRFEADDAGKKPAIDF